MLKGEITMRISLSLFVFFFALPAWGGYTGDNLLLWVLVAFGLLAAAVGCLWAEYRNQTAEQLKRAMRKSGKKAA